MKAEDAKNPQFLKVVSGSEDAAESEALLEKFRELGREFDPASMSPDSLSEATQEALDFIEQGVRTPLSEEQRARYIAHLEKLSFIRARMKQEQGEE